jgi:hypothetical protein
VSALLFGIVVAFIINLVTAYIDRDKGIKLLPWLLLYAFLHGLGTAASTDTAWRFLVEQARRHPGVQSYLVVAGIACILALVFWRVVNESVTAAFAQSHTNSSPGQLPSEATKVPPQSPQAPQKDGKALQVPQTPAGGVSTGPVTIQPGGAASFGQVGGQTAGVINNPPVNPNAAVITYTFEGHRRERTSGGSGITVGAEEVAFKKLLDLQGKHDWGALVIFCEEQRKKTPEWITPIAFEGLAYGKMNNGAQAVAYFKLADEQIAGNPDYEELSVFVKDSLTQLRAK